VIADLKPYADYKDSGLPWLGQVPAHWRTVRNGSLFGQRSQNGFAELPILEVSLRTGVQVRSFGQAGRKQIMSDLGKYKRAVKGDLAYNTMRMWQGALGVCPVDGLVSPAYVVARPYPGVDARYFAALFRTGDYMAEIDSASRGIVKDRNRLYWDQFKQMQSPCPPFEEQVAIMRFLENLNGRLERAIRAKRKVIALLSEQTQAVIQGAVTFGLDQSAPLKPSGIPWLGEIPQHWESRRLRSLATKFGSGVTPRGGASVYQDSGIPLLRSQNIHFGELRLDKVARIAPAIHEAMAGTHVRAGDVLLNITGASIGRVCAVPPTLEAANVNQHVCIIRPISTLCDSEYLAMFLGISAVQTAIYAAQSGSSREGLPIAEVKALRVALPSLTEQFEIRQTVKRETLLLRSAIATIEREIELLHEFRARLVVDVVTGKLDVRGAALRLLEDMAPEAAFHPIKDVELSDEEAEV
jgi:type I restriction enzyme S subunit